MAPLHGPGEGLEPDVVGSPVPAEGDELDLPLHLAFALEGVVGGFHPGEGGAGALKGGVDVAVLVGGVRIEEGAHLQAAGGIAHHGAVLLPEGPEDAPDGNPRAAAGAETVAPYEALLLLQRFLKMIGAVDGFHVPLPPLSQMGVDRAQFSPGGDGLEACKHGVEVGRCNVPPA